MLVQYFWLQYWVMLLISYDFFYIKILIEIYKKDKKEKLDKIVDNQTR